MEINHRIYTALVDSGASDNFIQADLVPALEISSKTKKVSYATSNHVATTLGTCTVPLVIEGRVFITECQVIEELREELILGFPWMEQQEALIDTSRKCIYLGHSPRVITHWRGARIQRENIQKPLTLTDEQLGPERPEELREVLQEFACIFHEELTQPTTKTVTHRINLTDSSPVRLRPYKYSPKKVKVIREEITKMLEAGVIRESTSAYCSPIVIVEKKTGEPRFCVDYRRLNKVTVSEFAGLPPITDMLKSVGKAKYFSVIDLKSGYWQIPMEEASKQFTAFSTPDGGQYEFNVLPFGLKNAPASFQKMMQHVLAGYVGQIALAYLDDVVVFSENFDDHLDHLRRIFERFKIHGLHCGIKKCQFARKHVEYLGHVLTDTENLAHPKHLAQLTDYPAPTSLRQVRAFLGTAGWLREFIPRFSEKAAPLYSLTKKGRPFRWTSEAQRAYEEIKQEASAPMRLFRPDPEKRFFLQTDASAIGMSAVLYQEGEEGQKRIISHASAKFKGAELNYHANEAECFAAVWSIKRYRPYLENRQFTLRTDSRSLTWLERFKENKQKLVRWALLLQEFDFTIEHVSGRDNELPDFLSRNPEPEDPTEDIDASIEKLAVPKIRSLNPENTNTVSLNVLDNPFQIIEEKQRADLEIRELKARWRNLGETGPQNVHDEEFFSTFTINEEKDLLYKIDSQGCCRLVVPTGMTQDVIYLFHDATEAGHPGREETLRTLKNNYYWSAMDREVKEYVRSCLVCAAVKTARQVEAPLRPRTPRRPWQMVSIDILGPYETSRYGNSYALIAVDLFTKWVEVQPIPVATTNRVVSFIEREIFARWGAPEVIITDNGAQFLGLKYERLLELNHVQCIFSPVYHQQSNPVERKVQEFKKILRTLLLNKADRDWEDHIHSALYCLRNRQNSAIRQTPAELLLGYTPPRPGAWILPQQEQHVAIDREERINKARARQIMFERNVYPEPRQAPVNFQPGEPVLVKNHAKGIFGQAWIGPHPIVRKEGENVYSVDCNGSERRVHVNDLRRAPPPRRSPRHDDPLVNHDDPPEPDEQALANLPIPDNLPVLEEPPIPDDLPLLDDLPDIPQ